MHAKTNLVLLGCCLGFLGTTSQVVLIRELLIAFTGNELTIATVLAIWLISVSLGCLAANRARQPTNIHRSLATLFIIAGLFSLLQVLLIRAVRPTMAPTGELLSPAMTVALAALGVSPCAAVLGAIFVRLVRYGCATSHSSPVPAVYGGEAFGAGLAGAVLSLWLLEAANPLTLLSVSASVGAICSILTLRQLPRRERGRGNAVATAWLVLLAIVFASADDLDLRLRNIEWEPLEVVETVDSKYGNIVVTARDGLHDFFETGALGFTIVDPMFAEETVHIPLLFHPDPRRVLIIGGSGSGVIPEAFKHPSVERVDFVEMDPSVIALAEQYGPAGWLRGDGRRTRPIFGDGRSYVARTGERYDVVIVAAGLPLSLRVNRIYTMEFFTTAREAMAPGGLVALKVDSPGAYMGPEFLGLLSSLVKAARRAFSHVALLPGDTIHLIASDCPVSERRHVLIHNLEERGLTTSYINAFVLRDRLLPLRAAQLDSLLTLHEGTAANSDARPVTFSYALAIWAKHFTTGKAVAWGVSNLDLGICALLLSAAALIIVMLYTRGSHLSIGAAAPFACLYSMGFTTMFTQVLIMLCFQISRGYIYGRLAVIIASFMVGLGLTATLAGSRLARAREYLSLVLLQAAMVALPLIVIAVFRSIQGRGAAIPEPAVDSLYIVLSFIGGVLGAAVFAVASASLMRIRAEAVGAGALSYSIDLVGASLAGFTTGFLTIPALGIVNAALAVCLANFVILGVLQFATRRSRRPRSR